MKKSNSHARKAQSQTATARRQNVEACADHIAHLAFRKAFDEMWAVTLKEKFPATVDKFVELYVRAMQKQTRHHAEQWGISA